MRQISRIARFSMAIMVAVAYSPSAPRASDVQKRTSYIPVYHEEGIYKGYTSLPKARKSKALKKTRKRRRRTAVRRKKSGVKKVPQVKIVRTVRSTKKTKPAVSHRAAKQTPIKKNVAVSFAASRKKTLPPKKPPISASKTFMVDLNKTKDPVLGILYLLDLFESGKITPDDFERGKEKLFKGNAIGIPRY